MGSEAFARAGERSEAWGNVGRRSRWECAPAGPGRAGSAHRGAQVRADLSGSPAHTGRRLEIAARHQVVPNLPDGRLAEVRSASGGRIEYRRGHVATERLIGSTACVLAQDVEHRGVVEYPAAEAGGLRVKFGGGGTCFLSECELGMFGIGWRDYVRGNTFSYAFRIAPIKKISPQSV